MKKLKSKKHKNEYKLSKMDVHCSKLLLSKTDIFYQTNEFETTTEGKYYFAKLLVRDSLFGKASLCIKRY